MNTDQASHREEFFCSKCGERTIASDDLRGQRHGCDPESLWVPAAPKYEVGENPVRVAWVAAIVIGVSVFLPLAEPTSIGGIRDNSIIQAKTGQGIGLLVVALAIIWTGHIYRTDKHVGWAMTVWGFMALAAALNIGLDEDNFRLTNSVNDQVEDTSPDLAVYVLGLGALVTMAAGIVLRASPRLPPDDADLPVTQAPAERPQTPSVSTPANAPPTPEPQKETKTCPDCAESIRVEAKVCRFCGFRFDG